MAVSYFTPPNKRKEAIAPKRALRLGLDIKTGADMRSIQVLTALCCVLWGSLLAAEDVLYYGNGWPISLVETACDGDEGCLTLLANCPPRTDGSCGVQVAWCRAYDTDRVHPAELCVIDLMANSDGSLWRLVNSQTLGFPDLGPSTELPCKYTTDGERLICVAPIISPDELRAWAGRPIN